MPPIVRLVVVALVVGCTPPASSVGAFNGDGNDTDAIATTSGNDLDGSSTGDPRATTAEGGESTGVLSFTTGNAGTTFGAEGGTSISESATWSLTEPGTWSGPWESSTVLPPETFTTWDGTTWPEPFTTSGMSSESEGFTSGMASTF